MPRPTAAASPSACGGVVSKSVWIAGFPSYYGGADTELDHLIDLFVRFGVETHLVPMFGADDRMRASVIERGGQIHDYCDDVFAGETVISFCNGSFLEKLPAIMSAGAPRAVIWFNCMTWLFEREKKAHENRWITLFGFQTDYQRRCLVPELEQIRPGVATFPYRPFFNTDSIAWKYRPFDGYYRVGRISRDDECKFAADTWRIFERVLVPAHLGKKVYILGYGPNAARRIGPAPTGLDWQTWGPNEIPSTDFYRMVNTLIHKTGGSRENCPRTLLEAYAHGVVPVVENDFGFVELVVHGETGFCASSSDEMSYYASLLASEPRQHRRVAETARDYVADRFGCAETCFLPWNELLS
jgi:glycosyltransferase involved in cell wall biosynthesis